MEPEPTIAAMAARAVVFGAVQHGIAPPELCARVGLDPALLADIDGGWAPSEREEGLLGLVFPPEPGDHGVPLTSPRGNLVSYR